MITANVPRRFTQNLQKLRLNSAHCAVNFLLCYGQRF